jgi:predicted transcriptional regulator of viral defense system
MTCDVIVLSNTLTRKEDAMQAREGRSLPAWLADIVQDFELHARRLVSADDVQRVRPELSRAVARLALAELVRRGWLVHAGRRGAYEFIPGAAAGVYPSGDPWLTLRAALERQPDDFHVGAVSAAWLRGYAQRRPPQHVVVSLPSVRIPRSLTTAYHVLRTQPAPAHDRIDGLPLPTAPELIAEVAQLAPRLSLDTAQGWLRRAFADATPKDIVQVLRDRRPATRARAGYFAEVCGAEAHAAALAASYHISSGPYFTGPRTSSARFSARWRVYDSGKVAAP